jgi:hypothetical protein
MALTRTEMQLTLIGKAIALADEMLRINSDSPELRTARARLLELAESGLPPGIGPQGKLLALALAEPARIAEAIALHDAERRAKGSDAAKANRAFDDAVLEDQIRSVLAECSERRSYSTILQAVNARRKAARSHQKPAKYHTVRRIVIALDQAPGRS